MQLTVLGRYGSFPGVDGACSGYLLEEDGRYLLMECGNGVLGRLQRYCPIEALEGIVVSHLHADHMGDLLVLRYGLEGLRALGEASEPLPLYVPATPEEVVRLLDWPEVFALTPIADGVEAAIGPFDLAFTRMEHSAESYAITVQAAGRRLVYSGDTAMNPQLLTVAEGAGLFLCEATAPRPRPLTPAQFPHLTAIQAGDVACRAGVGELLLTHIWFADPPEEYEAEARRMFSPVAVAEEMVTYEVKLP